MIDRSGVDRLLLRNPAKFKGGFWLSYIMDDEVHLVESTEPYERMDIIRHEEVDDTQRIVLHTKQKQGNPILELEHHLWSKNKPILLWKLIVKNSSKKVIRDLKGYVIMDCDIGGPRSFKDDFGAFDKKSSSLMLWDDNSLFVNMSARPEPNGWEIAPPLKLKVIRDHRDLQNNEEVGPQDVAGALQWDLGDLQPGESAKIELILTAAEDSDSARALIKDGVALLDKKLP